MSYLKKLVLLLPSILCFHLAYGQTENTPCPLAPKTVAVEGGVISYLQGGSGPPVLLLHGLFGEKEHWLGLGCSLANQGFNVIAPDLPGYGRSTNYPVTTYPLESQVNILHRFMGSVTKESFHIAGNSMGGAIAALYAHQYSGDIKTVAFIGAPLGVIDWSEQVRGSIFQGVNPFIPINTDQLDLEMRLLFLQPPNIDESIKLQLIKEYQDNNRHYQQVWSIVNFYTSSLNRLPKQSKPTLILWGERDEIFSIAGLPALKKTFPKSQAYPLANASHLLMIEDPVRVAGTYGPFLKRSK